VCHRPIKVSVQPIAEEPTRTCVLLWNTSIAKDTIVQEVTTVHLNVGNLGAERDNKTLRMTLTSALVVLERVVTRPEDIGTCAYCGKPANKFAMPTLSSLDPS
jgi:hypothetical protein